MTEIHVIMLIVIIKVSFTTTSFYCFINGKIKKEPAKIELDINVAKAWANGKFCSAA